MEPKINYFMQKTSTYYEIDEELQEDYLAGRLHISFYVTEAEDDALAQRLGMWPYNATGPRADQSLKKHCGSTG